MTRAKTPSTMDDAPRAARYFPVRIAPLLMGFGTRKYPVLFWNSPDMASPPKKAAERTTTKLTKLPQPAP